MHKFDISGKLEEKDSLADILYQRHASAIFVFLCQHVDSREDAEDLLLEVFTAALEYEKLPQLDEEQQLSWLWRVARNKAIDNYRRHTRRPMLLLEHVEEQLFDEEILPEQHALRQDEYRQLHVLLRKLTPLQQEIIRLRFANDLRCAEIAQILGKKESAVRVLLLRTLRLLRTLYVH